MNARFLPATLRCLAAAMLLGSVSAGPDIPAGNVLYTVGTTFSQAGQHHVYLLWTPTDEDLLRLRSFSIWSKAGAADGPGQYRPESWVKVQTDPAVIELTLRRAERLGQDLATLNGAIDGLFEMFRPVPGMTRAQKLSVIIQGAQTEPELYHDLLVLARLFPAVSLSLGAAYTGLADGLRTYEVRMAGPEDGPDAPDAARRVVGRVTLDPAAYQSLPAPGAPVSVPFGRGVGASFQPDARANLNARMRWATPDALREKSLLQFGYHVYRVEPAFYTQMNMGSSLNPGDLAAYAQTFPTKVRRVSSLPVVIDKLLTQAEAADRVNDPNTFFLIDDNGRFKPGGVPFQDGDEFKYMVTAVDVLGRDGIASPPTDIQILRTVGPNQPRNLAVRDQVTHPTSTTTRQVFGVHWQAPAPVPDVIVHHYDIYRWENAADAMNGGITPLKVGTANAVPGQEWYAFEDASLGVPPPAPQLGRTWWFTVRAVSQGAVIDTASSHSAPASGVLRDRSGPPLPQIANVLVTKGTPVLEVISTSGSEDLDAADPGFLNGRITLTRTSSAISGADIYYRLNNTSTAGLTDPSPLGPVPRDATYLGSVSFKDGGVDVHNITLRIPLPDATGTHSATFHLRARDKHGSISGFAAPATLTASLPTNDKRKLLTATARHSYSRVPAGSTLALEKHVSRPAGVLQTSTPQFQISIPTGTSKWRIYRRIDLGSLELVKEGSGPPPTEIPTEALSVGAGEVSYFLQLINSSGTAGPLAEMGHFEMTSIEPPPQPMLLPLEALPANKATLTWACATGGVRSFHVGIAAVGKQPATTISPDLSTAFENRSKVEVVLDGKSTELDFRMYDTGTLPQSSSPQHSVTLELEPELTYYFIVESVSPAGELSKLSNLVAFAWQDPVDGGPDAVWPARPSAQINHAFITPKASMSGIVVGTLNKATSITPVGATVRLSPPLDLMAKLHQENGEKEGSRPERRLLPCVVFRYQLPNEIFPRVSGDVVQVSPLIKGIAARTENIGGTDYTVVYDPYFNFNAGDRKVRLRPPQPLTDKATYRYLLLLFRPDGEIDSVVPTTTFTVDISPN